MPQKARKGQRHPQDRPQAKPRAKPQAKRKRGRPPGSGKKEVVQRQTPVKAVSVAAIRSKVEAALRSVRKQATQAQALALDGALDELDAVVAKVLQTGSAQPKAKRKKGESKNPRLRCTDCGECNGGARFGRLAERKRLWCQTCAKKNHSDEEHVVDLGLRWCEDCTSPKKAVYKEAGEESKNLRWCSKCGPTHNGVLPPKNKKLCEGCNEKLPTWGLPKQKKRWCRVCGLKQPGAVNLNKVPICEDCRKCDPTMCMPGERRRRWCANCGPKHHPGSIKLQTLPMCVVCKDRRANYTHSSDNPRKRRWCLACSKIACPAGETVIDMMSSYRSALSSLLYCCCTAVRLPATARGWPRQPCVPSLLLTKDDAHYY